MVLMRWKQSSHLDVENITLSVVWNDRGGCFATEDSRNLWSVLLDSSSAEATCTAAVGMLEPSNGLDYQGVSGVRGQK